MAVLSDYQFEMDGYLFGLGMPIFVDAEGFETGDAEWITQDGTNPISGARMFGRDVLSASTWTFACHVDMTDAAEALASAAAMGAKWRNEASAKKTGAVKMLRYAVAGRTRVVFGRPRRFSFKPGNDIMQGHLPPLATFDLVDSKHYDDLELVTDLHLVPDVEGGFEVPFVLPLPISRAADAGVPGGVLVGGDAATAPVVTFYGPSTNPKVTIGGFICGLTGTLPETTSYTVDARPWAQSVSKVGAVGATTLNRDTRFANAMLPPGSYSAIYQANDPTGGSACRIRWRNAWHTL